MLYSATRIGLNVWRAGATSRSWLDHDRIDLFHLLLDTEAALGLLHVHLTQELFET